MSSWCCDALEVKICIICEQLSADDVQQKLKLQHTKKQSKKSLRTSLHNDNWLTLPIGYSAADPRKRKLHNFMIDSTLLQKVRVKNRKFILFQRGGRWYEDVKSRSRSPCSTYKYISFSLLYLHFSLSATTQQFCTHRIGKTFDVGRTRKWKTTQQATEKS